MDTRTLPQDLEAERGILGAMLVSNEALRKGQDQLRGDDFYLIAHKQIFETAVIMQEKNLEVDVITVADDLAKRSLLDKVGGFEYMDRLAAGFYTIQNFDYYCKIIKDKATLRKLIETCNIIANGCYETEGRSVVDILDRAERDILKIGNSRAGNDFVHVSKVLGDYLGRLEELSSANKAMTGLSTGFNMLDYKTSGLQKSDLIILAARPAMGKTALALNVAVNVAMLNGATVAVFSLEMSKEQLVQRVIAAAGSMDSTKLRTGKLTGENDWEMVMVAVDKVSSAEIFIDDTPSISVMELRAKCRRLKRERGSLGLIVIDYLQLMQSSGRAESRHLEISEISRSLKALARELDCPVLSLAQLSRAPEMRSEHRPILSDLKESGSIEQDADLVMLLYRDKYYNPETETPDIAELIVAKHRHGTTGTVELMWKEEHQKFHNLELRHQEH